MLSFVNLVIDRFDIGPNDVRVAFVRYADQANVEFNLDGYRDANRLKAAISAVQLLNGGSNLAVALHTVHTQVFGSSAARQGFEKVAIVITDQLQGSAALTTAINNVKSAGIRVYGVGIHGVTGRQMNITTLYALSHQSDSNNQYPATFVSGYSSLPSHVQSLLNYTCTSKYGYSTAVCTVVS